MTKKNLFKSIIAATLAVVMCLSVVGCGLFGGKTPEKTYNYTYRTYTGVSPSNWNELTYQDNNDTQIMSYLGSSFYTYDFKYDENGEIVPGEFVMKYDAATKLEDTTAKYADAWGLPADGKGYSYTITLREDLKWDDGTPIKAEDFVYTMQQQLDPLFQNYRADSFYVGATVIHNAQNYVKQGQTSWAAAHTVFTEYSTDLDSVLVFKIGPATDENPAECYVRKDWAGFPESYGVAATASYLIANYVGESAFTVETAEAMEGKTLAEIKADPTLNAAWEAILGWWQTEPNEELDFLVSEVEYPETAWEDVGIFVGDTEYEIVLVLDKALDLLKDDGSLSYKAAYNMASLPLVKKDLYEANKVAPSEGSTLWTSTYHQSAESTASWGAYKLESFQTGKQYTLVKNDNWYGYNMPENEGLYQTERIICDTVKEWASAWSMFQAGQIDGIGIDVSIADEYKGSDRAYFTPDDYVGSLQLQSNVEALEGRETDGINKTLLSDVDFRKALSLAIDRAAYNTECTTSSLPGFGLFNSMHYYDVENGGVFRNSDEAKKVLCEIYAVDYNDYPSLDDAVNAITGYNLEEARKLVTKAYEAAIEAGTITETDKFKVTFGSSIINEAVNRNYGFIANAWIELFKGTPLEGRFDYEIKEFADKWAEDFRDGAYDVCMGGWTGAAWDPGYFLLAYLSPSYMYSLGWATDEQTMTFTMKGVAADGGDITETMSLIDWYNALNGQHDVYDFSSVALEESQRLQLIAALEKEVLKMYYTVPIQNNFSASLISYKIDYTTYEYNTFMGYGGIKYMTYNFTDAEWAAEVAAQGGTLDYK